MFRGLFFLIHDDVRLNSDTGLHCDVHSPNFIPHSFVLLWMYCKTGGPFEFPPSFAVVLMTSSKHLSFFFLLGNYSLAHKGRVCVWHSPSSTDTVPQTRRQITLLLLPRERRYKKWFLFTPYKHKRCRFLSLSLSLLHAAIWLTPFLHLQKKFAYFSPHFKSTSQWGKNNFPLFKIYIYIKRKKQLLRICVNRHDIDKHTPSPEYNIGKMWDCYVLRSFFC